MVSGKRILLLASSDERSNFRSLEEGGYILSLSQDPSSIGDLLQDDTQDMVMADLAMLPQEDQKAIIQLCKRLHVPILALVPQESQSGFDHTLAVDDFLFYPIKQDELRARVRRTLWRAGSWDTGQVVRSGDLVIDQERYEVSVAGRRVNLTFKEYQLFCLLASNPGRVYSRETLLSQIWEYDYFGGTRTVDVHIRRVRSKVEDSSHQFIETVRNVGYRFREA